MLSKQLITALNIPVHVVNNRAVVSCHANKGAGIWMTICPAYTSYITTRYLLAQSYCSVPLFLRRVLIAMITNFVERRTKTRVLDVLPFMQ